MSGFADALPDLRFPINSKLKDYYTVRIGDTLDIDTIFEIQAKQITLEKAGVRRTLCLNTTPLLK